MKLNKNQYCHTFSTKAIVVFIFMVSALSCENLPEYRLPGNEVFIYSPGDTFAFKSDQNNVQIVSIDRFDRKFLDDSHTGFASLTYEHQEVSMHFQHDENLIQKYDSILLLWQECYPVNGLVSCDSFYNYSQFDMSIELTVTGEPVGKGRRWFKWKKLSFYDFYDTFQRMGEYELNGTIYENVYKFERDTSFVDSTMPIKTMYFNYQNGILKYENLDSEVFELQGKL